MPRTDDELGYLGLRGMHQKTDLTAEPFKLALVRDLNAALQIDLQEREKGETMTWLA